MRTSTSVAALVLAVLLAATVQGQSESPIQWPLPPPAPEILESPWIDTPTLRAILDTGDAYLVDLRPSELPTEGHISEAISAQELFELASRGPVAVLRFLERLGVSEVGRPLILVADPRDLSGAGRVLAVLEGAGWRTARLFTGGTGPWGRPGEGSGAGAVSPGGTPRGGGLVSADWLRENLGQVGIQVVDVRGARDPSKPELPAEFEAGHIPGSLPLDVEHLASWLDGRRTREELRARIASFGPRASDPLDLAATLVVYGSDGADPAAGLAYLLLRHAGTDVRWFPGGWSAWTSEPLNPTARVISTSDLRDLLLANDGQLRDETRRDLVILDLRTERDFVIGHLPGAQSAPFFPDSLDRILAEHWPGIDRSSTPVLLYCYGIDCVRSWKGTGMAPHFGFTEILWFRGGVPAWREAGLPLPDSLKSVEGTGQR